jgi:hypothetical protein
MAIFNIPQTISQCPSATIAGLEDVSMKIRFVPWECANQWNSSLLIPISTTLRVLFCGISERWLADFVGGLCSGSLTVDLSKHVEFWEAYFTIQKLLQREMPLLDDSTYGKSHWIPSRTNIGCKMVLTPPVYFHKSQKYQRYFYIKR